MIGYANPAATGTTNMAGITSGVFPGSGTFPSAYTTGGVPNATRYVAINCAFTAGGTVSSIQNNTIGGFALYTSSGAGTTFGIFCGIAVTSGNVNIGTVTGNTIGATSGNGSIYTACTTSGGMVAGIYVTSSNAVAIQNNKVGAIDAMGTTATISGGINGINIAGVMSSYDVSGNTIGNIDPVNAARNSCCCSHSIYGSHLIVLNGHSIGTGNIYTRNHTTRSSTGCINRTITRCCSNGVAGNCSDIYITRSNRYTTKNTKGSSSSAGSI